MKILTDYYNIDFKYEDYEIKNIDSNMIKHIKGPWDNRYYDILSYLFSRNLISYGKEKNWDIIITEKGIKTLEYLKSKENDRLIEKCNIIKKKLGNLSEKKIQEVIDRNFAFTEMIDNG